MHIQVINFQLDGVSEEQYRALCDEVAPAFAEVPGLVSKVWLASPETNTYGGVYTWESREALEAFKRSELFAGVTSDPSLAGVTSKEFGVLEGPTALTRGASEAAGVAS